MKVFILTIALLFTISDKSFSQKIEGKSIKLKAISSATSQEYFIETNCLKNEIKIEFKFRDSVLMDKLSADTTYKSLLKYFTETKLNAKDDSQINLFKRLDSVVRKNTVYSIDSIIIKYNQYPEYEKLIATLVNSSQSKLENKGNNKRRIVLDGTSMYFSFFRNEKIKFTAQAQSPNKTSHPLLNEYLNSTVNIYKELKKDNLLLRLKSATGK
jgi:hypothetical protein